MLMHMPVVPAMLVPDAPGLAERLADAPLNALRAILVPAADLGLHALFPPMRRQVR